MPMIITATVNKSDYDNMLRNFWLKEDIDAELEVDGVQYPKGEIAYRGSTSLAYPKKGFKIKFKKKNLYLGHTKRIDLSASYVDKSLIRERLCFDLFGATGALTPTAWHVAFTIRSKAGHILERGLFTGIEHIDKYFFRNRSRDRGTLYKADGGAINGVFEGAWLDPQPEEILRILYDKKATKKILASGALANMLQSFLNWPRIEISDANEEDYSDLHHFITELNTHNGHTIINYLPDVMDVESYLDWLAVNTLLQSNDTYHKNYYLHNRVEDDKWEILPWDYDLTFGRNWNDYCGGLCDDLSEGTSIKGSAQMINRLSKPVLNNPTYFEQLKTRLLRLLESEFSEAKLFPKIDAYYTEITPLAHADTRKWPTNQQFDHERDRLKDWIKRRRAFLYRELGASSPITPRPDTIVAELRFDRAALIAGDQIAFEAVVQNIGSAAAGPTVGVAFLVDDTYITFGSSGVLDAGASRSIKSVSTWQAVAGEHRLTAVVDDVNRYPEISETNNSLEIVFRVQPPPGQGLSDVIVKDIAFEREPSGQIRLAALIANQGQAATADVVGVAFLVDDQYATFGVIEPLAAGVEQAVRANSYLPLTGTRKITAIADDVNRFPEEREQNNTLTQHIDFGSPQPSLSDVLIADVRLGSQGRFTEGDLITFEAVVKNIGAAPTGDVVGVAFLIDGQYITFGAAPIMAAGETRNIRAVSPWQAVAGRHSLLAISDDINRFPEASETNNRFELSFDVLASTEPQLPDSTVDAINYERDPAGQITLTATVSNIGNVPTPDVVGVAFLLNGQYLTYGTTQPMPPGATEVIRAVQSFLLTGRRTVTAIADDVNRYDEISHQNNSLSQEFNFSGGGEEIERRAIWITRYDWTNLNQTPGPEKIDRMVANINQAGFNTIFFQVRGAGDAYYTPGLEPWAARLTGSAWATLGQGPGWDPLAHLLEKAHAAGIEVHAYLNAYTVWLPPANQSYGQLAPPTTTPPHFFDRFTYSPAHSEHPGEHALGWQWRHYEALDLPMTLAWGKYLWASPGVDLVQDHIVSVAVDLTSRYALDGIHLDHIRYAGEQYSFDPSSNAAAGDEKTPQRDQWQRDRITELVSRIYAETKSIRPNLLLSAAVWPYYKDKWGWNLNEGYTDYYQDSHGWLAAGVIDAIAPMLYDGLADDFSRWQILMQDFVANSAGRHVYPGIGASYDDFNEIAQRIEAARQAGAPGHAIFSYGGLEQRNYWAQLAAGPYAQPAIVPKLAGAS